MGLLLSELVYNLHVLLIGIKDVSLMQNECTDLKNSDHQNFHTVVVNDFKFHGYNIKQNQFSQHP